MKLLEKDFGFSVADAEYPDLHFEDLKLKCSLVDWRGQPQEIVFEEVVAFRWDHHEYHKGRDDTTYEVIDSSWLKLHVDLDWGPPGSPMRDRYAPDYAHYRLCFNAFDLFLDVAARRIDRLGMVGP